MPARRNCPIAWHLAILACFLAAPAHATALQEAEASAVPDEDFVVLANGDRLTGQVKGVERGRLRFETDATGVVQIEWQHVVELASRRVFEVETSSGAKHYGTLGPGVVGSLRVGGDEPVRVKLEEIVAITRIKHGFWSRWGGSIDAGFSYTQANSKSNLNFGLQTRFRAPRFQFGMTGRSILQTQEKAPRTSRHDLSVSYQRFFGSRWFVLVTWQGQINEELNLKLRALGLVAVGRHLFRRPNSDLGVGVGVSVNHETFFSGDPGQETVEAVIGVLYDLFRYGAYETSLNGNLMVYPSLSTEGRVRVELNLDLRQELVEDLFVGLGLFNSYDSRPPVEGAERNDFGLTASVGWSF